LNALKADFKTSGGRELPVGPALPVVAAGAGAAEEGAKPSGGGGFCSSATVENS
jgi:hypothetical protein